MGFITDWAPDDDTCRHCGEKTVRWKRWESSDGGHDDICYDCTACKQVWWVDGPDY